MIITISLCNSLPPQAPAEIHEEEFIQPEKLFSLDTKINDFGLRERESLGFIISVEQGGGPGTACGLRSNEWYRDETSGVWAPGPVMQEPRNPRGLTRDSNE